MARHAAKGRAGGREARRASAARSAATNRGPAHHAGPSLRAEVCNGVANACPLDFKRTDGRAFKCGRTAYLCGVEPVSWEGGGARAHARACGSASGRAQLWTCRPLRHATHLTPRPAANPAQSYDAPKQGTQGYTVGTYLSASMEAKAFFRLTPLKSTMALGSCNLGCAHWWPCSAAPQRQRVGELP